MAAASLYRRILAEQFDALPGVLRRFHDHPGGGCACGDLRVVRGQGHLSRLIGAVLGLPQAGDAVPVRLRVAVEGDRERWVREFASRRVETVQWEHEGLLFERFGPTAFASELVLDGVCLRYEFRRAWLLGIPLPRWLAPDVTGAVQAGDNGWTLVTEISLPLAGRLVRYDGWVVTE